MSDNWYKLPFSEKRERVAYAEFKTNELGFRTLFASINNRDSNQGITSQTLAEAPSGRRIHVQLIDRVRYEPAVYQSYQWYRGVKLKFREFKTPFEKPDESMETWVTTNPIIYRSEGHEEHGWTIRIRTTLSPRIASFLETPETVNLVLGWRTTYDARPIPENAYMIYRILTGCNEDQSSSQVGREIRQRIGNFLSGVCDNV